MRYLPFLLLASLPLLPSPAQAQTAFSIGPRIGLNLATYHFAEVNAPNVVAFSPPQHRIGFEAGVASSLSRGHFALQGSLLYAQRGYTEHTEVQIRSATNSYIGTGDLEHAERLNYLTLPLALAYTQHRDGQGFQVFAGPYLSLFLSGRYDNTVTSPSSPTVREGGVFAAAPDAAGGFVPYVERYDAGLQGGLGYRYQALLFQAGYSLGLRNVALNTFLLGRPRYNRAFQASLAYFFGPKS